MTIDVSTPETRRAIQNNFLHPNVSARDVVWAAFKRIGEQEAALAECYRQSGADPDDNEDWRLATGAVQEVTRMRRELDGADDRIDELESLARDLAKELMEHRGPQGDAIFDRTRSAGVHP